MSSTGAHYDLIIVGGGVIGATLALSLARHVKQLKEKVSSSSVNSSSKARILLIERDWSEPDRIVGELLQPDGVAMLTKLQCIDCVDKIDGQVINGYGLNLCSEWKQLSYPATEFAPAGAKGIAFHNGRFIQKMRTIIEKEFQSQVEISISTAKKLLYDSSDRVIGVEHKKKVGDETVESYANLTVIADGCNSGFRKSLFQSDFTINVRSKFLGLELHDTVLPFPNHGHVILAKPSPVLVYPIASNDTRILIDFPANISIPTEQQALNEYLLSKVKPQLPAQIQQSFHNAVLTQLPKVCPNQSMGAQMNFTAGIWLVGDSLNTRHPLTGGGMTVGFTDLYTFINTIKQTNYDFSNTKRLDSIVQDIYYERHNNNACINILADALYGVTSDELLKVACYSYLSLGSRMSGDPVKLLSGISRSQPLLITHFFMVAFWGMAKLLFPIPTPTAIINSCTMIRSACRIILPLIIRENKIGNPILKYGATIVKFIMRV